MIAQYLRYLDNVFNFVDFFKGPVSDREFVSTLIKFLVVPRLTSNGSVIFQTTNIVNFIEKLFILVQIKVKEKFGFTAGWFYSLAQRFHCYVQFLLSRNLNVNIMPLSILFKFPVVNVSKLFMDG